MGYFAKFATNICIIGTHSFIDIQTFYLRKVCKKAESPSIRHKIDKVKAAQAEKIT